MANKQDQSVGSSHQTDTAQPVGGAGNSAAVDQVFSMFKDYLEKKLEDKGVQIVELEKSYKNMNLKVQSNC